MAFQISLSQSLDEDDSRRIQNFDERQGFFVDFVLIALHWKNKMNAIIKEKTVKLRSV